MTIREALREAVARLHAAQVPDAPVDARLLLARVMGLPPLELLAAPEKPLRQSEQIRFFGMLSRREKREPLQYILGLAAFMGHEFEVAPGVLIPRQDTEALCQRAIHLAGPGCEALDLCCGSGCLGISLKLARPEAAVWLGDISEAAIRVSERNARRLGAKVTILRGDLWAPFEGRRFDLILSNPPYIPAEDMKGLQEEVRQEPELALVGGPDGLDFYRKILARAADFLRPGGSLLLELGDHQAAAVSALVPAGFEAPRVHPDLAGLPRVLETRRPGGVESSHE